MAQTGFTPIQLYYSTTAAESPIAANLANGELAINITDGKLFYKENTGTISVIGWKLVPTTAGGTGQTTYVNGQLLIGNSTGNTLTKATLTAGSGISVTNGTGSITLANTGVLSFDGGSTGLSPSTATTGVVSLSGTLGVGYGGTGQTTYTNGQLLIGNTTGNTLTKTTLTAGSGVSISNGAGSITISATGSGGTVTAVTGTAPVVSSGGTTPAISMPKATTSVDGYLSSTDWTTFNNKGSGTVTSVTASGNIASSGGATPNITFTGTLPTANGGTNLTSFTSNGVVYASSSSVLTTGSALQFDGTNLGVGGAPAVWYSNDKAIQIIGGALWANNGGSSNVVLSSNLYQNSSNVGTYLSTDYAAYYSQSSGTHTWYTAPSGTSGTATSFTPTMALNTSGAVGFGSPSSYGSSGQVLTSAGSSAAPTWTTPTTGTVTSVTGTAPVVSSGGTTPAISMAAATTSVNGYLTSTDWTTFNNKQAALVSGTNIKTVNGTTLLGSGDLGTIGATYGGTGQSSYAVGDLLYASTTTALSKLADVATGNALISGGVGVAPSWGKITLTTHVSGVLPVANGGTNASTASITSFNNITGYSAAGATGTTTTNIVFSTSPTITTPSITGDATLSTGNVSIGTSGKGITTGSSIPLGFGVNGSLSAATIDTSSNLNVGQTTAITGAKLTVNGQIATSPFISINSSSATTFATCVSCLAVVRDRGGGGTALVLYDTSSAPAVVIVSQTGAAKFVTTAPLATQIQIASGGSSLTALTGSSIGTTNLNYTIIQNQ